MTAQKHAAEDRWTGDELATIRAALEQEATRLRGDIDIASRTFGTGVGDFFEGTGDEVGDVGSLMVELSEGSTVASNENDILRQCERALERLHTETYGVCDSCGKAIAKARLKALPRATHCISCQQRGAAS